MKTAKTVLSVVHKALISGCHLGQADKIYSETINNGKASWRFVLSIDFRGDMWHAPIQNAYFRNIAH